MFAKKNNQEDRRKWANENIIGGRIICVDSEKGGAGKTMVAANLAAAFHKIFGKKVAVIEGNIDGPNLGDVCARYIPEGTHYLGFHTADDIKPGEEGERLRASLVEAPNLPGFFIGAVPNIQYQKNLLNRRTGPENYIRLAEGIKQLREEFIIFADMGTGKNRDQILSVHNQADVRVVVYNPATLSVLSAVSLIQTSQLETAIDMEVERLRESNKPRIEGLGSSIDVQQTYMKDVTSRYEELQTYIQKTQEEISRLESEMGNKKSMVSSYAEDLKEARAKTKRKTKSPEMKILESKLKLVEDEFNSLSSSRREKLKEREELQAKSDSLYQKVEETRQRYESLVAQKELLVGDEQEKIRELRDSDSLRTLSVNAYGNSDGYESRYRFSPTIGICNRVKGISGRIMALRAPGMMIGNIRREGYSTSDLYFDGSFSERRYIEESGSEGLPLVYNDNTRNKSAASKFEEFAWFVAQHLAKPTEA